MRPPLRLELKTKRLPSCDQPGSNSQAGSLVSGTASPRAMSMIQMSDAVAPFTSDTATRRPSGLRSSVGKRPRSPRVPDDPAGPVAPGQALIGEDRASRVGGEHAGLGHRKGAESVPFVERWRRNDRDRSAPVSGRRSRRNAARRAAVRSERTDGLRNRPRIRFGAVRATPTARRRAIRCAARPGRQAGRAPGRENDGRPAETRASDAPSRPFAEP